MSETKQIKGFCQGEVPNGDWSEFHINIGRQYPVKLSTKQDDVKALARAAGRNDAVWTFSESDGNPNPHKPGTFFKNRWLSKVEVGGVLDPTLSPQPSGGSAPAVSGDERVSIERQTIIKAVVPLVGDNLSWEAAMQRIRELDAWIGTERPTTGYEAAVSQADDEDIPF